MEPTTILPWFGVFALTTSITIALVSFATSRRARRHATEADARARSERDARLEVEKRLAVAETTLQSERDSHAGRLEEIDTRFEAVAAGALKQAQSAFLQLAEERMKRQSSNATGELDRKRDAIAALFEPVGESLGKLALRVEAMERSRTATDTLLQDQVRDLRSETARLASALRRPKTRGQWGEYQLRQVLEIAGMTEHLDFVTEHTLEGEQGRQRPDVQVRLPGGRSIFIDAKTPLDAYLDAVDAEGEDSRRTALARHASHFAGHVDALSSKEYWNLLPDTPDFVVMFVPSEALFDAAARVRPDLFDFAFERKVLIATPTTLVAVLKAIAYGWQQEALAQNTREVAELGKQLYERLAVFGMHMNKLGDRLRTTIDQFNQTSGSLERRLLPAARRMKDLGAISKADSIESSGTLELFPRELQSDELRTGEAGTDE